MLEKLILTLRDFAGIPEEEAGKLFRTGVFKTFNTGDFFIRTGEAPKTFGFVGSGLFRYVYMDDEGRQYTKTFMPEYRFISSYSAMVQKTHSYYSVEALEPSEVLEFDYFNWTRLRESHPCWDRFLIKMLEKGYGHKEKREREFLLLDSETRYRIFLEEYPTLESRVKQHMIASYLGITPESLSRIRKKMPS